jgi:hypothetical protein
VLHRAAESAAPGSTIARQRVVDQHARPRPDRDRIPFKRRHCLPTRPSSPGSPGPRHPPRRSAALDLADVAAGRFDGFELHLAPWDVAAGTLLVREAGGVVTGLDGRDLRLGHGPVVAGNPTIHRWLLETLHQDTPS